MTVSNYLRTDGRRFIQYNMWKNCRTGCDFCFNRGYKRSSVQDQKDIIQFTTDKLLSEETDEYNEVGFIGGEFFDNQLEDPDVRRMFYNMFKICADRYRRGLIKKICVATSLVFDISKSLIPFIQYLKDLDIEKITLFCTSYDTKYRFHTQERHDLWCMNMKEVRKHTTNMIHTEIIVSQFFIDDVISGKLDLEKFQKEFDTSIDYIEPTFIDFFPSREASIEALPDFFPRRSSFIEFVREMCLKRRVIDISRFLSIKLRSDTSYYRLESGEWIKIDDRWHNGIRRIDKTGKAKEIFSYSDSDVKMTDDVQVLMNAV